MKTQEKPTRKKHLLLKAVLVIVFFVSAFIVWNYVETKNTRISPHPEAVVNETASTPITEKPTTTEFDSYSVPGEAPRYLFIPKIDVQALVKPMGVTAANQIEAPASAYDAGWYTKSAKPGHTGVVLLDGHVSAGATPGIFSHLMLLAEGETIIIERGDGARLEYRVVETRTYDASAVDMAAVLSPINPKKPGLNLITCTGSAIRGQNNYDKRLVVFAEQLL